ncbi:MAG: dipeptide epimerase, partial [Ignavibacteriaceae bacterium]|nr:dipeptide epimerase [Ignavibacteriaceae bacterium]
DLEKIKDSYSGVNIKLMKAGGIRQAYRMMQRAKELNLKIMLGCMTETSCAITAASHLAPLADWVDLDGAELISNDLFTGMKTVEGALSIPDMPGIGVEKVIK